ncbi:transmembrane protein [Cystoisospora suis]|uniref:Transmembrane protein n=1 Tax=Cystoisospora suis TaxID=483139 RepID=A0A2C6L2U2_9APIC|nr:transmembrane protein [Cystoisospora suis]
MKLPHSAFGGASTALRELHSMGRLPYRDRMGSFAVAGVRNAQMRERAGSGVAGCVSCSSEAGCLPFQRNPSPVLAEPPIAFYSSRQRLFVTLRHGTQAYLSRPGCAPHIESRSRGMVNSSSHLSSYGFRSSAMSSSYVVPLQAFLPIQEKGAFSRGRDMKSWGLHSSDTIAGTSHSTGSLVRDEQGTLTSVSYWLTQPSLSCPTSLLLRRGSFPWTSSHAFNNICCRYHFSVFELVSLSTLRSSFRFFSSSTSSDSAYSCLLSDTRSPSELPSCVSPPPNYLKLSDPKACATLHYLPFWARITSPPRNAKFVMRILTLAPLCASAVAVHLLPLYGFEGFARDLIGWSVYYGTVLLATWWGMHAGIQLSHLGSPPSRPNRSYHNGVRYAFVAYGLGTLIVTAAAQQIEAAESLYLLAMSASVLLAGDYLTYLHSLLPVWLWRERLLSIGTLLATICAFLLSEQVGERGRQVRLNF